MEAISDVIDAYIGIWWAAAQQAVCRLGEGCHGWAREAVDIWLTDVNPSIDADPRTPVAGLVHIGRHEGVVLAAELLAEGSFTRAPTVTLFDSGELMPKVDHEYGREI